MKRKIIVVLILIVFPLLAMPQAIEIIKFDGKTHDFGVIKEEDGAVEHQFNFVNTSDRPIQIMHVKASCGCTTPGWSRDTIPVGGTGFIKAKYDPRGRPGVFNKYLTATSVPIGPPVKLYIKGNVTPRPRSITDEFPVGVGKLRSKFRVLNFGRIKLTESPSVKKFPIYNESDSTMSFHSVESPKNISVSFEPEFLGPRERGFLVLSYNTLEKNDYGFQNENIAFQTDELGDDSQKSFSVYTNIEEYFPPMNSSELANAPLVSYDRVEHDFGNVKKDSELKTSFKITNDGKEDLIIRKVESNCACVTTELDNKELKPGESATILVVFNTRSRTSHQQKSVTVYSNSPKKPISRLIVKAYVEPN